jgi:uncharacterized protein
MSIARAIGFLSVMIGLTAGVHVYLWYRLVREPAWPSPWGGILTGAIIGLALSVPLAFVGMRLFPRDVSGPLSWIAFGWMGAVFFLMLVLLPSEIVRQIARGAGGLASPERREFMSRAIAVVAASTAAGLGVLSTFQALGPVKIARVTARLRDLPDGLRGFTIAQLTDVHVGPTIGKDFVEDIVRRTNALEPDMIAITGDLVDGSVAELGPLVAPLADLRARHGVFFVTGNHEYYSGADEWTHYLETLGIRVLRNERVTLEHDGAEIDVAGVDDWTAFGEGHGRDLRKALAGRAEDRKVVLLAHQPKQIEEASELGVDLQISGHTHGGQIMPFNHLVRLQQPYVVGMHDHGGAKLYVSPGTGYWGPPMRLGVPAEITRIELA